MHVLTVTVKNKLLHACGNWLEYRNNNTLVVYLLNQNLVKSPPTDCSYSIPRLIADHELLAATNFIIMILDFHVP